MSSIADRRRDESAVADLWHTDAVDVDAYLARIGQPRRAPSAAALQDLTRAHVLTIPLENIDVVLGRHRGIELDVVAEKLVGRQRGGYCYEHGGLFAVVDQAGWPHRLVRRDGWWILQKRSGAGWDDLHEFLPAVRSRPIDYQVFHHHTSTHPRSPFTGRPVVMRLADGVFRRLLGRELTHQRPDGGIETRTVEPAELDGVLRDLDVVLTPDELAALLARY